jgi:hypothetical protein
MFAPQAETNYIYALSWIGPNRSTTPNMSEVSIVKHWLTPRITMS